MVAATSGSDVPPPPRDRAEGGFLLFEVLVAALIGALVITVLIHAVAQVRRAVRVALDTEEAIVRARSRLAALDGGGFVVGQRDGDDGGGFTWHTRVVPLGTAEAVRAHADQFLTTLAPRETLYAVTVAIEWRTDGAPRRFALESMRLGPPPPTP